MGCGKENTLLFCLSMENSNYYRLSLTWRFFWYFSEKAPSKMALSKKALLEKALSKKALSEKAPSNNAFSEYQLSPI